MMKNGCKCIGEGKKRVFLKASMPLIFFPKRKELMKHAMQVSCYGYKERQMFGREYWTIISLLFEGGERKGRKGLGNGNCHIFLSLNHTFKNPISYIHPNSLTLPQLETFHSFTYQSPW